MGVSPYSKDLPANEGNLPEDKGEPQAKAKSANCGHKEQKPMVSSRPFRNMFPKLLTKSEMNFRLLEILKDNNLN